MIQTDMTGNYGPDIDELGNDLCQALHEHEQSAAEHSRRVARLARLLGEKLGLPEERTWRLELACLLHDIGKLFVSADTLTKPGALNNEEWEEIKNHPEHGYSLLRDKQELFDIAETVYSHHERYDGAGYPRGLAGNEICLEARICAVVDAYDAMTSERSYKPPLSHEEAIQELIRCSYTQFDPGIVAAFISIPEVTIRSEMGTEAVLA
ncbi:MAG TPA: HD-GYP domain-containing protein [Dehalococcoidia bacterium]|nr:HD-GYP domain-containing protein [Dehalococcoidia bacterium]